MVGSSFAANSDPAWTLTSTFDRVFARQPKAKRLRIADDLLVIFNRSLEPFTPVVVLMPHLKGLKKGVDDVESEIATRAYTVVLRGPSRWWRNRTYISPVGK